MGSSQSSMATLVLTAFVIAGAGAVGYLHYTGGASAATAQSAPTTDSDAGTSGAKRKQKKKKGLSDDAPAAAARTKQSPPIVVPVPQVLTVPGAFEPASSVEDNAAAKAKKSKKKKGKKAAGAEGRLAPPAGADSLSDSSAGVTPVPPSASAKAKAKRATPPGRAAEDGPGERWTRVESRRKVKPAQEDPAAATAGKPTVSAIDTTAHTGSDAGITTSVTGGSSPGTEDDGSKGGDETLGTSTASLSENPAVAPVRIQPGDKPAKGFTWDDYEGVQIDNHADDEDDGGWGVVKSKGRSKFNQPSGQTSASKAPETMTKKQRQNAAKREAQKAAKEDAEAERLAILSRHKRELEQVKMAEQFGQKAKGSML